MPETTFLCVMAATHGLYAERFLHTLFESGARVLVVTRSEALGYDWPRQYIHGLYAVDDVFNPENLANAVAYLMRHERIDRILGPGEYDIDPAARLRADLGLPGLSMSAALPLRDKLAMRQRARDAGLAVPAFVSCLHHPAIHRFMETVPGPWVLKPRTEASSKGIRVLHAQEAVWRALDELGDGARHHLLERYVAGDVYHVDAIAWEGEVHFARAHRYGKPILELHSEGGIYTTRSVPTGSPDARALLALNAAVMAALGLTTGVGHLEFIKSAEDGRFYFLEAGARVGAGLIEELVEAESGLALWAEWARIELALAEGGPYAVAPTREACAGVLACTTAAEHPDATPYAAPGVEAVPVKPHHLGLLVTAPTAEAVDAKLQALCGRIQSHERVVRA